ncbi:MAG TPA: prephenate dehydrogenase [Anaerolineaceae bacterium]|nr:prephenate dehydrogenase [Anaerolineaceae bacterium]HPN52464.1 prephenate dehydrogenase [Anaerolineaceae bacterium]
MATIQLSIIGLGQIGTSLGLALQPHKASVKRVGNDRELLAMRAAEKAGAIDSSDINLPSLVRGADVVVLAVPPEEIRETLAVIRDDLKDGVVILDTSLVKTAAMKWAEEILKPEQYFIGWLPVINPEYFFETEYSAEGAHADLFKNSMIAITSGPGTPAKALKLASDLANLIDATPFYPDPLEVEGLTAGSHLLPLVTAAALSNAITGQPGWGDGRRLAGASFAMTTLTLNQLGGNKRPGEVLLTNRENTLRVIEDMSAALNDIRDALQENDADRLNKLLRNAIFQRDLWLKQRYTANYEDIPQAQNDEAQLSLSDTLKGLFLGRRFGKGKK